MPIFSRPRSYSRLFLVVLAVICVKLIFFPSKRGPSVSSSHVQEIAEHNFIERATIPDRTLNVHKHAFLQSRLGRDERAEVFGDVIQGGISDYWERFQLPYIVNRETAPIDAQQVFGAIDQLLSLNGWVAALCPTLVRPFGQNHRQGIYDELIREDHLYFIGVIIHSADHFLLDQLAVIVQLAKRLGTRNLFVSMLDYASTDSTETLTDLCEAVLVMLGIPFRIRRVPAMTEDPSAAYYPLEEAHMRNLALEPLHELNQRRKIKFDRVIWLKGFTCPNDILESIKVSFANEAAMVCGMDWAEHNGNFIFSDRWRTRDIEGDQFRQSRSTAQGDAVPPRDREGSIRYSKHLPFQVFCCESGMHVVDPVQSYYKNIIYRAGADFHNLSRPESAPIRGADAPCLDSSQAWFCRDLWISKAKEEIEEVDRSTNAKRWWSKRQIGDGNVEGRVKVEVANGVGEEEHNDGAARPQKGEDADANAGSDYDAMPGDEELPPIEPPRKSISNALFRPARVLVNPRCPTTYAGVSHTQLAKDLFGTGEDTHSERVRKYVLEDWEGAPDSFVCQEQRQTGGRQAPKSQRRLGFSIQKELEQLQN